MTSNATWAGLLKLYLEMPDIEGEAARHQIWCHIWLSKVVHELATLHLITSETGSTEV